MRTLGWKSFLLLLLFSCKKITLEDVQPHLVTHELKWVKHFGGSLEDVAHAVIQTRDGGFAFLGNTKSTDFDLRDKTREGSDLLLVKYTADGELAWSKTYGGSQDERGHALVQMPDGGYALLGYAMSSDGDLSDNAGQHDNWVVRVDAQGELLWQNSYGFSGHDHAYNIIATQDGGLFFNGFLDVTSSGGLGTTAKGNSSSSRHGVGEFWCHKIDATGELEWRRYYGGTNNDRSYDAIETPEGGFVVVGTSESTDVDISSPQGDYDVWVIALDGSGNMLWERSLGGSNYDGANAIVLDEENRLHVFGNTFSQDKHIAAPLGASDFWLVSLNLRGELLSEKTFGGSNFDLGRDLIITNNTHFWLTGYSRSQDLDLSNNKGNNDVALLQLDAHYFPLQSFSLGGSGQDLAHALVEWGEGGILVVGSSESNDHAFENNRGDKDVFLAFWHAISE
ncbi:MAG: hypothetical protein ACPIB2_03135 [Flavobacteriaceae bacterium]